MRSEQEIREKLAILKDMKEVLEIEEKESKGENPQGWEGFFLQEKIDLLKWVLGEKEEL